MKTAKLVDRLAAAILSGRFFHVFLGERYHKSFFCEEVARSYGNVKEAKVIQLTGGRK